MSATHLPPIARFAPFVLVALAACGGSVGTSTDADVVDAAPDVASDAPDADGGGTCYAPGTPGPAPCSATSAVDCSSCPASCVAFGRAGVCQ